MIMFPKTPTEILKFGLECLGSIRLQNKLEAMEKKNPSELNRSIDYQVGFDFLTNRPKYVFNQEHLDKTMWETIKQYTDPAHVGTRAVDYKILQTIAER